MALTGDVPLTVEFTDESTPSQDVVSWSWAFGDGDLSTEQNPTHVYDAVGRFRVTLGIGSTKGVDTAEDEVRVTQNGLRSHWTLDETEGEERVDSILGYNLSESGAVGSAAGAVGDAADFVSGRLEATEGPELTEAFTLSLRFKVPSTVSALNFLYSHEQLFLGLVEHRFYAEIAGWSGTNRATWPVAVVDDDSWHHAVVWVDPNVDMLIHCELDGAADSPSADPLSGTLEPTEALIHVGHSGFGMLLDDIKWYGRALSPAERALL